MKPNIEAKTPVYIPWWPTWPGFCSQAAGIGSAVSAFFQAPVSGSAQAATLVPCCKFSNQKRTYIKKNAYSSKIGLTNAPAQLRLRFSPWKCALMQVQTHVHPHCHRTRNDLVLHDLIPWRLGLFDSQCRQLHALLRVMNRRCHC